MDPPLEQTVELRNSVSELAPLTGIVDAFARRAGLADAVAHALHIAVDEMVSNIILHGYDEAERGEHTIRIRLSADEDSAVLRIEDRGRPFNPLAYPPPDVDAPLEEREVGGLGVHLVRSLMDEVAYEYVGGANRVTLTRRFDRDR